MEIYGGCENYTVTNCYIYQVYDAGLTQQYGVKENDRTRHDQRNVRYADNVIEKCNYSIEYFLSTKAAPDNPSRIENFVIEDNLMFDAGVGFCEQRPDRRSMGGDRPRDIADASRPGGRDAEGALPWTARSLQGPRHREDRLGLGERGLSGTSPRHVRGRVQDCG